LLEENSHNKEKTKVAGREWRGYRLVVDEKASKFIAGKKVGKSPAQEANFCKREVILDFKAKLRSGVL